SFQASRSRRSPQFLQWSLWTGVLPDAPRWHRRKPIPEAAGDADDAASLLRDQFHRRRPIGVERLDRLEAPGLAFFAFGFGPANGLPVRSEDQPRSGIGNFHAIATGFVDVQKESLLNSVLVRARFDIDAIFEKDIRCQQHLFSAVNSISDVMETSFRSGIVARIGEIVRFVGAGHPYSGLGAIVENDLLREPEAKILFEKFAIGFDVHSKCIPMIEAADVNATGRKSLGLILQSRTQFRRRFIPLCFVIKLDLVPS